MQAHRKASFAVCLPINSSRASSDSSAYEKSFFCRTPKAEMRSERQRAESSPAAGCVVCAAMLMDDGLIVPGVRHFSPDMRRVLHRIYGDGYHKRVLSQGFILSDGAFVCRETAREIAELNGQMKHRCGGDKRRLFSENLY